MDDLVLDNKNTNKLFHDYVGQTSIRPKRQRKILKNNFGKIAEKKVFEFVVFHSSHVLYFDFFCRLTLVIVSVARRPIFPA